MFDPKLHYYDAKGFARDKRTHHLLGIEEAPPPRHPNEGAEYPKWVTPHRGHVKGMGEGVSTPLFPDFHVNRISGDVTVLVHDAEEEARAVTDPNVPAPASDPDVPATA